MSLLSQEHLQRITDEVSNRYHLHNLSDYIEKHMYLEGKRMKFGAGYKFQKAVINDTSRVTNIVKLAQIGATTSTIAYFLAGMACIPRFNVIYALPSASDAGKLTTTKVNPLIYESPALKRLLDKDVDSVELKRIGSNFLFTRGSKSETAALSISADCLVIDELDRCDPETVKQFRSRLQASPLQIIKQFSTPTISGIGISKEGETSKRYRHMATCSPCGHKWLPSFHTDIVIPDYSGDLTALTAQNIKDVKWQAARWNCPNCGRDPKLKEDRMEWVCENPEDNFEANTYYISPATACEILKPAYFVRTSTEFLKRSEFLNQVLGETAEEENEQITQFDIDSAMHESDLKSSEVHYLGADMGLLCAVSIGRLTVQGQLIVVHREMVPLANFESRRRELIREYKVIASVHDTQPYVSEIMRICDYDVNAYGAIFTTTKSPELYTLQEKEEDAEAGKLNLRLLKVNRTALFDTILGMWKEKQVVIQKNDKISDAQYLSLKRSQVMQGSELVFAWVKSDGNDHMLFSLGYLYLACRLRRGGGWTSTAIPLVSSFSTKKVNLG